jgi:hypothetical protein
MCAWAHPHGHTCVHIRPWCGEDVHSPLTRILSLPSMSTLRHPHTQTASTGSGGAGRVPFRQRLGSSARPTVLAADARGYFKPGSMDDFW